MRWQHASGPLECLQTMLLDIGWDPRTADSWVTETGVELGTLNPDAHAGSICLSPLKAAVRKAVEKRLWTEAALRWNGGGVEHGVWMDQARGNLTAMRKHGHVDKAAMLVATSAASAK